jgi:hypothetical protein
MTPNPSFHRNLRIKPRKAVNSNVSVLHGSAHGVDKMYPYGYNDYMIEIRKTDLFAQWLDDLRDIQARARVQVRIERSLLGILEM